MAYKAGKILTFGGNNNLVQRLETSGPGSLNIPTERIRETGNELTVSIERDVPDLSFEIESKDMSIATEAMVVRRDPTEMADGDVITLGDAKPIHFIAPIKGAGTSKTALRGVAWPDLTLEQYQVRVGVGQNATQSLTFRGDSQYGIKGTPYSEEFGAKGVTRTITGTTTNGDATVTVTVGTVYESDEGLAVSGTGIPSGGGGTTIDTWTDATHFELSQNATASGTVTITITVGGGDATYSFANTGIKTVEQGADVYAYGLCVYFADGTYKRLFHGYDYSNTSSGFTLLDPSIAPAGSTLAVVYGSTTPASFPQSIHSTPSVLPGAIRGKHINLYVAKGPSRTFTITTANGDATVTASSPNFTAADVGATLRYNGEVIGIIDEYTDSTHVEMADVAVGTLTGVSGTLSPELVRWRGVQQVEISWRVSLEYDDELGNIHHVSSDYDTPELSGSFSVKPESADYLFDLWAQVSGTTSGDTSNLTNDTSLEFRVAVKHPTSGAIMKTWRVADSRIKPPPHQARAGQKLETQFAWESDSGLLEISKGAWAA